MAILEGDDMSSGQAQRVIHVGEISAQGQARTRGVQEGMQVLVVNDQNVDSLSYEALLEQLRHRPLTMQMRSQQRID